MCHKFMAYPLFSFLRSFFHRISWMNRRRSCLSDYSRIFADIWPLANGWRPKCSLIVFVTQISQMTQISLRGSFLSHRFHRFTQILDLFGLWKKSTQISQMTQFFCLDIWGIFLSIMARMNLCKSVESVGLLKRLTFSAFFNTLLPALFLPA